MQRTRFLTDDWYEFNNNKHLKDTDFSKQLLHSACRVKCNSLQLDVIFISIDVKLHWIRYFEKTKQSALFNVWFQGQAPVWCQRVPLLWWTCCSSLVAEYLKNLSCYGNGYSLNTGNPVSSLRGCSTSTTQATEAMGGWTDGSRCRLSNRIPPTNFLLNEVKITARNMWAFIKSAMSKHQDASLLDAFVHMLFGLTLSLFCHRRAIAK